MKRLATFIAALAAMCSANAQTTRPNYYMDRDTVYGQNVTYIVNIESEFSENTYLVNNICNAYNRRQVLHRNGSMTDPQTRNTSDRGRMHNRRQIFRALKKTFNKDKLANIYINFHPDSFGPAIYITATPEGKVIEVKFRFPDRPEFTSISPDSLFMFEQNIKKYVHYRRKDYCEPDKYAWYNSLHGWFPFGHQKHVRMYKRYADEEWLKNAYFKIF